MTPEERMQKLSELFGKAKKAMDNAVNKGADAADNLGRKIDDLLGPQDYPEARPANDVAKANDVAEKQPKAPKKTKRIYRF